MSTSARRRSPNRALAGDGAAVFAANLVEGLGDPLIGGKINGNLRAILVHADDMVIGPQRGCEGAPDANFAGTSTRCAKSAKARVPMTSNLLLAHAARHVVGIFVLVRLLADNAAAGKGLRPMNRRRTRPCHSAAALRDLTSGVTKGAKA
jgi:hypothetical protein